MKLNVTKKFDNNELTVGGVDTGDRPPRGQYIVITLTWHNGIQMGIEIRNYKFFLLLFLFSSFHISYFMVRTMFLEKQARKSLKLR